MYVYMHTMCATLSLVMESFLSADTSCPPDTNDGTYLHTHHVAMCEECVHVCCVLVLQTMPSAANTYIVGSNTVLDCTYVLYNAVCVYKTIIGCVLATAGPQAS